MHLCRLYFPCGTLGISAAPQQAGSAAFTSWNAGDGIYGCCADWACRRSCSSLSCVEEDRPAAEQPDRGLRCGATLRCQVDGDAVFLGDSSYSVVWHTRIASPP